jgi:flagellar biosynthesis component FlhA
MDDAIALYMNYARIVKNRQLSFFSSSLSLLLYMVSACPNICIVRFALLQYDYYARSSSSKYARERKEEEEKRKSTTEKGSTHRTNTCEPMKQVSVCACMHSFFPPLSLALFHAHARAIVVFFLFYPTPKEQRV